MDFSDLAGRRVAIWGYGREGRAAAEHLSNLGIAFELAIPDVEDGEEIGIAYGANGRAALLGADIVIKSPGVPITSPLYAEIITNHVQITSLTDLWMGSNAPRTVAVTGTKGKSTTATLLAHILKSAGREVSLRGNIGTTLLSEPIPPSEIVVMELSSYQAQSLTVSPRVVVITSLFPEHLTWHGSLEGYYRDKLNAIVHGPEIVLAPGSNDFVLRKIREVSPTAPLATTGIDTVNVNEVGDLVWQDGSRLAAASIPLLGLHQAENAALAALASQYLGVKTPAAIDAIASFKSLPHRMERVPSNDGRTWIDDSLATAPEAVVASLRSLPRDQLVALLVGGQDRGLDFDTLSRYLSDNPHVAALLSGPVGERVHAQTGVGRVFGSFVQAAEWARSPDNPARIVLLAPGAPSFDEFSSYEQRSATFRQIALGDPPSC